LQRVNWWTRRGGATPSAKVGGCDSLSPPGLPGWSIEFVRNGLIKLELRDRIGVGEIVLGAPIESGTAAAACPVRVRSGSGSRTRSEREDSWLPASRSLKEALNHSDLRIKDVVLAGLGDEIGGLNLPPSGRVQLSGGTARSPGAVACGKS